MSIKTIQEESLTALGNAIRAKTGSEDLLEFPNGMVNTIQEFNLIPDEAFRITGNARYRFAYNNNLWLLKKYGDKITTQNIANREYMFYESNLLEEIPFDINLSDNNFSLNYTFYNCAKLKKIPPINGKACSFDSTFYGCKQLEEIPNLTWKTQTGEYADMASMFYDCQQLKAAPYIYNAKPTDMKGMFSSCHRLKAIPEDYVDTWNWDYFHTYKYGYGGSVFNNCYSLRTIPLNLTHNLWNIYSSSSSSMYASLFSACFSLDEVKELGVSTASYSSNILSGVVSGCYRLKGFTFQTSEDGMPQIAKWKSQVLELSSYVGYANKDYEYRITDYNSGITKDKKVIDDETYQALKNDPDWFTSDINYSRYNRLSAVETINSLPDCSATGTNTIKFKGAAGALTDGGAINTMTEEEIAVAAAKGWTVTFV